MTAPVNAQNHPSNGAPTGPPKEAEDEALMIPLDTGRNNGNGKTYRVFILDDHPLFRFGLKRLINAQPDLTVCGEAQNAVAGLDEVLKLNPDLITVDISLNESTNGIEFVKNIRAHLENTRILVVSMHDESIYALRALRAGPRGI